MRSIRNGSGACCGPGERGCGICKRDSRFASVVIFKNHGRAAGARLDHAHSQLVAYPVIPPALMEKVQGGTRHFEKTARCIFCDVIAAEEQDARRVICNDDGNAGVGAVCGARAV